MTPTTRPTEPTARPSHENESLASSRHRLLNFGAAALSDAELLTLILRPRGGVAAMERLLATTGGLKTLVADRPWPAAIDGMTRSQAIALQASSELGRRLLRTDANRVSLDNPSQVYQYLRPTLHALGREEFHVLSVNSRKALLFHARVALGTANSCPVDPRVVFSAALSVHAPAIILAHNHPSGEAEPSIQDITLTQHLVAGGNFLGIRVLDHIIVGDGCFVSFLERRLLPPHKSQEDAKGDPT